MATINEMMKDFNTTAVYYEYIRGSYVDDNDVNYWMWIGSYYLGYREPRYPMPALTLPATYHPDTGWSAWSIATDKDQD